MNVFFVIAAMIFLRFVKKYKRALSLDELEVK